MSLVVVSRKFLFKNFFLTYFVPLHKNSFSFFVIMEKLKEYDAIDFDGKYCCWNEIRKVWKCLDYYNADSSCYMVLSFHEFEAKGKTLLENSCIAGSPGFTA